MRISDWSSDVCSSDLRLERGIREGVANSILVKVNQIGTLTETLETVGMATRAAYSSVMPSRSGATEAVTLAAPAVATNCGPIKTGVHARYDRGAKQNKKQPPRHHLAHNPTPNHAT